MTFLMQRSLNSTVMTTLSVYVISALIPAIDGARGSSKHYQEGGV